MGSIEMIGDSNSVYYFWEGLDFQSCGQNEWDKNNWTVEYMGMAKRPNCWRIDNFKAKDEAQLIMFFDIETQEKMIHLLKMIGIVEFGLDVHTFSLIDKLTQQNKLNEAENLLKQSIKIIKQEAEKEKNLKYMASLPSLQELLDSKKHFEDDKMYDYVDKKKVSEYLKDKMVCFAGNNGTILNEMKLIGIDAYNEKRMDEIIKYGIFGKRN